MLKFQPWAPVCLFIFQFRYFKHMPLVNIRFYYKGLKVFLLLACALLVQPVTSGNAIADERGAGRSSVSDILDSLVNVTYFRDEHFSSASREADKYGFPSNFVPQYSDSVYASRIGALRRKTPFNLVYNDPVKGFIKVYAVDKRNSMSKIIGLSRIYFPLFEEKLDKYNVPLEMKYLAIVESALNPAAVSPAGAKGLWQFMYGTGKMYGLQSSSFIEDRYDPYKATVAAARHLRDLYNIYGDWFLVLAAYNAGPGNVNKAIRRAGGVKDYWAIYDYLPAETRGYVPAFIAVNYLMNYYKEHNIRPVEPGYLYQDVDTLRTSHFLSFEQINGTLGIPLQDLKFLNPQYKLGIIPASTGITPSVLRLPRKYVSQFQNREQEIYAYKSPRTLEQEMLLARVESNSRGGGVESSGEKIEKVHIVQEGETLGSIARMFRTYVSQLIVWNNLKDADVTPGQKLIVFGGSDNTVSFSSRGARNKDAGDDEVTSSVKKKIVMHKVGRRETLALIARKYHTTVQRIMALNGLRSSRSIAAGKRLKVETEVVVRKSSRSSSRHAVVAKGRHSRSLKHARNARNEAKHKIVRKGKKGKVAVKSPAKKKKRRR
ncbi:MAG: transglycosylase SLT domain-containing protein [Chlorobiaceae bacterium]|nr:transglycosylase SLT domain-containing protein [Chlorobiaceae bacterium]NTV61423.1 transglycosylase SLT domain-containing protein [Chlorobiaceae bacterium]